MLNWCVLAASKLLAWLLRAVDLFPACNNIRHDSVDQT